MNTNKLNNDIMDKLYEFETLENIYPSLDWDTKLESKLKLKSNQKSYFLNKYNLIVLSIGLINVSLIVFSMLNESKKVNSRSRNFELISKELLLKSNQ